MGCYSLTCPNSCVLFSPFPFLSARRGSLCCLINEYDDDVDDDDDNFYHVTSIRDFSVIAQTQ